MSENGGDPLELNEEQSRALQHLDDSLEEFGKAMERCGQAEVPPPIILAKISEFYAAMQVAIGA